MTATDKLGIVERLTRTTKFRVRDGGPIHEAFRNSDGPEAAALIEELCEALRETTAWLEDNMCGGELRERARTILAKVRPQ
jgi:hypothetical protein